MTLVLALLFQLLFLSADGNLAELENIKMTIHKRCSFLQAIVTCILAQLSTNTDVDRFFT